MLIVFDVQTTLREFLAVRGRVETPRPERCPACGYERVTFAGWWRRLTRHGRVDIHRVVCGRCKATHSLWPDLLVARRMDPAELIGAALQTAADGTGRRPIAAALGLPAATVRGWLRAFRRVAGPLAGHLLAVAAAADPTAYTAQASPAGHTGEPRGVGGLVEVRECLAGDIDVVGAAGRRGLATFGLIAMVVVGIVLLRGQWCVQRTRRQLHDPSAAAVSGVGPEGADPSASCKRWTHEANRGHSECRPLVELGRVARPTTGWAWRPRGVGEPLRVAPSRARRTPTNPQHEP